ncbi:GNAT family N-acetyltransferase [Cognatishimia sp. WU-CL00825]|uniref:GNAT family N-acetyltransferase n=1 Tax=Cognatishimia sp. WU-CL00825 TaxID=3127658 RepID=UPI00310470B4
MITAFETTRLKVHNWNVAVDNGVASEWLEAGLTTLLTPAVLRHLPPPLQLSGQPNQIAEWVAQQAQEGETFLVTDRNSGDVIGLLIIAEFDQSTGVKQMHIGYLLAQTVWGQGIASELLQGLVSSIPTGQNLQILGGVVAENAGSARVLQKSGFQVNKSMSTPETDMYELIIA